MKHLFFFAAFSASLAVQSATIGRHQAVNSARRPQAKTIEIINDSGKTLVVEWVHPLSGVATKLSGVINGESTVFNSFVNHTFALHGEDCDAADHNETDVCPVRFITVDDDKDTQVARIQRGMTVTFSKDKNSFDLETTEVVAVCKEQARSSLATGADQEDVMVSLAKCLEGRVASAFQKKNDEIADIRQSRLELSAKMENYTCADPDRELSKPLETRVWTHDNVTRNVFVMHNREASQIHVLEDFISAEECEAIKEAAAPKLHRGTVADGSGGHRLSESRKHGKLESEFLGQRGPRKSNRACRPSIV